MEPAAEIWHASGRTTVTRVAEPPKPMSETSAPFLELSRVRFLCPNTAIVHAVRSQYGSLIGKREAPAVILVRKTGARWRIASYTLLGSFGPPARASEAPLVKPH